MSLLKLIAIAWLSAALCSCGGGGGDPLTFDAAVALAQQSRATAKSFALANLACTADADCTSIGLLDERSACLPSEAVPLSLLSPTAAQAQRAASDQNGFAQQAFVLSNRPPPPCPAQISGTGRTSCINRQCRVLDPSTGLPLPLRHQYKPLSSGFTAEGDP